jgi:hypothetical protein
MYANLTDEQRQAIVESFRMWKSLGCEPDHATACATGALKLSQRALNGKSGDNAWAAVLATLVMAKEITIS